MGEVENSTVIHYYLASGPDDPPKGPFSRSQLSHALLLGQVDPLDRIWVSDVKSWLVAQNVFSDFFESDMGRLTVDRRRQLVERRASQERRAALEDFAIQFGLIVSLVAAFAVIRVSALLLILLPLAVPMSYWLVMQSRRDGQSLGMERNGILKFQNNSHNSLSFLDALLRGILSFFLILLMGAEFRWRPRHRVTLSCHMMAAFPVFDESFEAESQASGQLVSAGNGSSDASEPEQENGLSGAEFALPVRSHSGTPTQPANPIAGPLPQRPTPRSSRRSSDRPAPGGTRPRSRSA